MYKTRMNRKIKFRVGSLDEDRGTHYYWKYFVIDSEKEDMEDGSCFNFFGSAVDGSMFVKLDQATWGQYTGIKDKNGKEIYEGDIVSGSFMDKHYAYPVIWHEGGWFIGYDREDEMNVTCLYVLKNPEISGNIYENPNFLEEKLEEEKEIYNDMKCHHWNGSLLVKSEDCEHKLEEGFAVKTLVVSREQALEYWEEFIKGKYKND